MPTALVVPAVVLALLAWAADRRRRAVEAELARLATATRRIAALRTATAALAVETDTAHRRHGELADRP